MAKKIGSVVTSLESSLSRGKKYLQDIGSIKRKYDEIPKHKDAFQEKILSNSSDSKIISAKSEALLRDIEFYCGLGNVTLLFYIIPSNNSFYSRNKDFHPLIQDSWYLMLKL